MTARRPSIASVIKIAQAAGLTVAEIIIEPGGFRVLTRPPTEALSEFERAQAERRARKAGGTAHGIKAAG